MNLELRRIRRARAPIGAIPDEQLYKPLFSPWLGAGEFGRLYRDIAPHTLVSADRCYVLYCLMRQANHIPGDFWECGVYKGGTAALAANIMEVPKHLHLFDTFAGMPETDPSRDLHTRGDFADTSRDEVASVVGHPERCDFHVGYIPDTFASLESASIAFAHIDVDIYRSVIDCAAFIWPRLSSGGFMVFDDYGFPSCPGARSAVDEFFSRSTAVPLCLPTGQAIIFKGTD